MANPEHQRILREGVQVWNRWIWTTMARFEVDLSDAFLMNSNLGGINFIRTNLRNADLSKCNLQGASFVQADLSNANLRESALLRADFSQTTLTGADFSQSMLGWTNFGNTDLHDTIGLENASHHGPSNIGIFTVMRSGGRMPERFLRGAGIPDDIITYLPSLANAQRAIHFYSCFISHSSKDYSFASRLHQDLRERGITCWFAPQDLKIGDVFRNTIDESITLHDKLLVVLSRESIHSRGSQIQLRDFPSTR